MCGGGVGGGVGGERRRKITTSRAGQQVFDRVDLLLPMQQRKQRPVQCETHPLQPQEEGYSFQGYFSTTDGLEIKSAPLKSFFTAQEYCMPSKVKACKT